MTTKNELTAYCMQETVNNYFKDRPQLLRTREIECFIEAGIKAGFELGQKAQIGMNREKAIEILGKPNVSERHSNTQMCKSFNGPSFLFNHKRKTLDINGDATAEQLEAALWWLNNECEQNSPESPGE